MTSAKPLKTIINSQSIPLAGVTRHLMKDKIYNNTLGYFFRIFKCLIFFFSNIYSLDHLKL